MNGIRLLERVEAMKAVSSMWTCYETFVGTHVLLVSLSDTSSSSHHRRHMGHQPLILQSVRPRSEETVEARQTIFQSSVYFRHFFPSTKRKSVDWIIIYYPIDI